VWSALTAATCAAARASTVPLTSITRLWPLWRRRLTKATSLRLATRMSIEFGRPAYDALAVDNKCQFVAADESFLRKLHQGRQRTLRAKAVSFIEAMKL
jgi:hypothetical protein